MWYKSHRDIPSHLNNRIAEGKRTTRIFHGLRGWGGKDIAGTLFGRWQTFDLAEAVSSQERG